MKYLTTSILFLLFLTACSEQKKATPLPIVDREIPKHPNGEPHLFYKATQKEVTLLNLDTLQGGYDSLQIRIWDEPSRINIHGVLVIKCTKSIWSATRYEVSFNKNRFPNPETLIEERIVALDPKHGWSKFLTQLFALQITTLPNMENILGLSDEWLDGDLYNIEVATKSKYRFYSYHFPGKFQDKYWQAKNMVDILKLTRTELVPKENSFFKN
jgi:hypothetical protein